MYKYNNNNNIIITIITLVLYNNIIILHDGGFDLRWQQRLNEKLYIARAHTHTHPSGRVLTG